MSVEEPDDAGTGYLHEVSNTQPGDRPVIGELGMQGVLRNDRFHRFDDRAYAINDEGLDLPSAMSGGTGGGMGNAPAHDTPRSSLPEEQMVEVARNSPLERAQTRIAGREAYVDRSDADLIATRNAAGPGGVRDTVDEILAERGVDPNKVPEGGWGPNQAHIQRQLDEEAEARRTAEAMADAEQRRQANADGLAKVRRALSEEPRIGHPEVDDKLSDLHHGLIDRPQAAYEIRNEIMQLMEQDPYLGETVANALGDQKISDLISDRGNDLISREGLRDALDRLLPNALDNLMNDAGEKEDPVVLEMKTDLRRYVDGEFWRLAERKAGEIAARRLEVKGVDDRGRETKDNPLTPTTSESFLTPEEQAAYAEIVAATT